jgi:hypothetical protein
MAVELANFERAVWARDDGSALNLLHRMLRQVAGGRLPTLEGPARSGEAMVQRRRVAERLAAGMATLFAAPDFVLDEDAFERLTPHGRLVAQIFALSALRSSDPVLSAIAAQAGNVQAIPEGRARLKYLFLWSLDSERDHTLAELFALETRLRLPLLVKLLDSKPVATPQAQRRREALLADPARLELGQWPRTDLESLVGLANAWMLCSYADGAGKHAIKAHLNAALRRTLLAAGLADAPLPAHRGRQLRPTIAVVAEVMQSRHVQYRYFGQWLRQLRADFRLVLVTETRELDETNRALFDQMLVFERHSDGRHVAEAARLARDVRPDILFYPSIGMRHWGVALANLRLAPIQATALGHSASSFSPQIDYYILEDGYVGDPAAFSETIALLPDAALRFERPPGDAVPPPRIRHHAPVLRVAVPSNALKLNARFLAALARIAAEAAPRRLEFHLFPNVSGFEGDAMRAAAQAILPGAIVWPLLDTATYLARLNHCDLTLSPFPFGGLHSTIDSLRLGLPVVAMTGREPHARTDGLMLRLAGMPDWLCAETEDAYRATALRIIGDDALRVGLSNQALACDVGNRLFGDASTPQDGAVARMFRWLYMDHEAIQASGRKLVRPDGDSLAQPAARNPPRIAARLSPSSGAR